MAIIFLFVYFDSKISFFIPAIDRAPAGSKIDLVSSKTSLIAAHISSVFTVIILSIYSFPISKVFSPTFFTATPSAN